ncbi:hypothetical protein BDY19DRAFT_941185 [Irpex rosettiformis]|uniref:Uncharacterized protein n=1 Tax=Irpex rosettiformis TaxID=378272 RepID=A0ACB8U694_9APHY|nr:hypothetical protein BDY19DRAFT_941185 [Irpex rosettiformis]
MIVELFIRAVEESGYCPSNYVLKDTTTQCAHDALTKAIPICGLFSEKMGYQRVANSHPMSIIDIPVEIKPQKYRDAFVPTINKKRKVMEGKVEMANEFLCTGMTGVNIKRRGQQIDYPSQIMPLQHRSHVFSISAASHYARLIRRDRADAVVHESFSYVDGPPNWLGEFLFRCSHATLEQCGFDTNVEKATRSNIPLLENAADEYMNRFKHPGNPATRLQRTVERTYPA